MTFVVVAEILQYVFRPLIGLGQQHAVGIAAVEFAPQSLQDRMRLRQIFVVGAFALDQIGDRVEAHRVDPHIKPIAHRRRHGAEHQRVVEIEVGLVRIKPVPVIGLRHLVPRPVRFLGVDEDDAGLGEFLVGVAPHIEIARCRPRLCPAGALEPGMLVRGMVDDQFRQDAQLAPVGFADEVPEIGHPAVFGIDRAIVGDVVAVVAQRRPIERQQPQRRDAQILQIIELAAEALKIADAVVIAVEEGLDVQLIDDRVLVPQRVRGCRGSRDGAEARRSQRVVGRGHRLSDRSRRKSRAGLVSGSRRTRCRMPRQTVALRPNASSSRKAAFSSRPKSASGNSISP